MTTLTPNEQLALEMINRARMDPDAEVARVAQEAGVPFTSLNQFIQTTSNGYPITSTSKQVLAGNNALTSAAESHSAALYTSGDIQNGGDPHNGAGDGTPESRIAGVGYQENPLSYYRPENVAVLWTTNQLTPSEITADTVQMHDNLFYDDPAKMFGEPGGHRLAMLDDNMKEIGIGEATGTVTQGNTTFNSVDLTEDFGVTGSNSFLTGAVYNDVNLGKAYDPNWFYDPNGAVAGVTARVTTTTGQTIGSDTTGSGGGWSVSEPGGTYNVTFTGPGIAADGVTVTVEGGNRNAKVDLVNGNDIYSNVSTTLGANAKDLHLLGIDNINATGNASDNVFYVDKGSHAINGGGGSDTVVYSGNEASYTITHNANGTVSVSGANGTDTLTSIAKLQFADQSVNLTPPAPPPPPPPPPVNHAPVVTGHDTTVAANAAVAASSLFSVQDQDGDSISKYLILDTGAGGGHLEVNGVAQAANSWVHVDAANLGSVRYVGGSTAGSEVLDVQAFDGTDWSANATVSVTTLAPANHAPVVSGHDTTIAAHAAVSVSSLFSAHDQDGDSTISKYLILDTGAGGGHLEVNGVAQAANSWVHVDAASLASVKYVGGSAAGSEVLDVQAFDGTDWSANATVTVKTLAPAAEDFNGDGKSDILWINKNGSVAEWQTDGTNVTANQRVGSIASAWHFAGSGDFNGDGKSDFLLVSDKGSVAEWQMNGSQITANQAVGSIGSSWHFAGTGDFNGDGKSDVLWVNDNGSVAEWQMNGSQIAANQTVGSVGSGWHFAGTGDFNGDGKSDILWVNDNGAVAEWQMNGSHIVANQTVGSVGSGWHFAGTGDFNGDGKTDILWHNDNGAVAEWQMNGSQIAANQAVGNISSDWHFAATGDYNRDGKADILWHNDNGATAVWEMNGSHIIGNHTVGSASSDWHIA